MESALLGLVLDSSILITAERWGIRLRGIALSVPGKDGRKG